jgi:hypothetical protein
MDMTAPPLWAGQDMQNAVDPRNFEGAQGEIEDRFRGVWTSGPNGVDIVGIEDGGLLPVANLIPGGLVRIVEDTHNVYGADVRWTHEWADPDTFNHIAEEAEEDPLFLGCTEALFAPDAPGESVARKVFYGIPATGRRLIMRNSMSLETGVLDEPTEVRSALEVGKVYGDIGMGRPLLRKVAMAHILEPHEWSPIDN